MTHLWPLTWVWIKSFVPTTMYPDTFGFVHVISTIAWRGKKETGFLPTKFSYCGANVGWNKPFTWGGFCVTWCWFSIVKTWAHVAISLFGVQCQPSHPSIIFPCSNKSKCFPTTRFSKEHMGVHIMCGWVLCGWSDCHPVSWIQLHHNHSLRGQRDLPCVAYK